MAIDLTRAKLGGNFFYRFSATSQMIELDYTKGMVDADKYVITDKDGIQHDAIMLSGRTLQYAISKVFYDPLKYIAPEDSVSLAIKKLATHIKYLDSFSNSDAKVSYDGADKDVELGEYGLGLSYMMLNTSYEETGDEEIGTAFWSQDEGAPVIKVSDDVSIAWGSELAPLFRNSSESELADFTGVMRSGTLGSSGKIMIAPAIANGSVNSGNFLGATTESIAASGYGRVCMFGNLRVVDTSGALSYNSEETWADNDTLYFSQTNAGYFTNVKPESGQIIALGVVVYAHATQGIVAIKPTPETTSPYDIATGFYDTPTADEVIETIPVTRDILLPADLSGTQVVIGTTATASFIISVQDDAVEIATITIGTDDSVILATTGNIAKTVATGSVLTLVAPSTADDTIANVVINIKGSV